jgi:hypothetical protein
MKCDCEKWFAAYPQIESCIVIAYMGGMPSPPQFKFCPWCGRKLEGERHI